MWLRPERFRLGLIAGAVLPWGFSVSKIGKSFKNAELALPENLEALERTHWQFATGTPQRRAREVLGTLYHCIRSSCFDQNMAPRF